MGSRIATLIVLVLAGCGERVAALGPVRVVSLHEVTTEMVVALGARARLVGVSDPVDAKAELLHELQGVARVDGLESILATRPTVVLGLQTVAEQAPEIVAGLKERGIAVWLGNPATLADMHAMVREIARRVGEDDAGAALVRRLEAREAGAVPARKLRVFVYDCCDPPFTAGGRTVLTDLIRRAGGENVFADLADDWTHVSWEAAVERKPELAIVNAYAFDGQGDVDAKVAALHKIRALEEVPVVVVPLGEALGGLRSVDGLLRLRQAFAAVRP
jgi:iron complex transport system substrate-binding protein